LKPGTEQLPESSAIVIRSQPTDSLLKIMMHRSDNFYAEQTLLMISNQLLGVMNDARIIDTLLKTVYAQMPQVPQWVDGSGLSRHNLISPLDFVYVLRKMHEEFGWKRITTIFASAGNGTLGELYREIPGKIYAKTGSMNSVVTLSGFLITRKGRLLIFSVLVNDEQIPASGVRSSVRDFLGGISDRY
jgi:D-alanyl-D-alanine carboxypeptidase/D-alanyl-D-alanine-endopeptidase (penicillin-binding protein 4)